MQLSIATAFIYRKSRPYAMDGIFFLQKRNRYSDLTTSCPGLNPDASAAAFIYRKSRPHAMDGISFLSAEAEPIF